MPWKVEDRIICNVCNGHACFRFADASKCGTKVMICKLGCEKVEALQLPLSVGKHKEGKHKVV